MKTFTHIDAFYQVVRYVDATNASPECPEKYKIRSPVTYRGTVKLHGANSGVACTAERVVAQSRTRTITPEDDNYGFAAFVARDDVSRAIRQIEARVRQEARVDSTAVVTLFGEWIGPGLQRGVAINQLVDRQWVLFAVSVSAGEASAYIDALPRLGEDFAAAQIFSIMDGPNFELTVDFADVASKEAAIAKATETTSEVEAECPWAARFGIAGTGEGIVWFPVGDHWGNADLFFKTKGDKHKKTKRNAARPQIAPEMLESIEAFVAFAVTENRLEQGLEAIQEAGHSVEMSSMPHFLKWMGQDVVRECAAELEVNGLKWKDVSKAVTNRCRSFFITSVQTLS